MNLKFFSITLLFISGISTLYGMQKTKESLPSLLKRNGYIIGAIETRVNLHKFQELLNTIQVSEHEVFNGNSHQYETIKIVDLDDFRKALENKVRQAFAIGYYTAKNEQQTSESRKKIRL